MSFQEVLSTIKSWPAEEQNRLFDELGLLPYSNSQKNELLAEAEQRYELYEQGKMSAAPWNEVRSRVRKEAGLDG